MVDLTNLFTKISTPFNAGSSTKIPETSFAASRENLNFADYRNLNNDNDQYVNEEQKTEIEKLINQLKAEHGTDHNAIALELYQGLKNLKNGSGESYDINSKEFLQNFNALTNQVKDDPALVNELRKNLVNGFNELNEEQRNLSSDARKEWYEMSYESSLDKLTAQDSTVSAELESLSKLDPSDAEDKKKIDSFINEVTKNFGDVAKFNELLSDAGIKYKVDGDSETGYSVKETTSNSSAVDPEATKAAQKETLNTWEKDAEFIQDLDTSIFETESELEDAQKKITELANLGYDDNTEYTKEELHENLELLTKAYKHNLETGEFSKAELDRARMNLISKVHEADKPAIEEYRKEYTGKTNKPHYTSEFSDGISKLNTIAFLRNGNLRENQIIPRLETAAEANGYPDIQSATGGTNSALYSLIEESRNWTAPASEGEETEKNSDVQPSELTSGTYDPSGDRISFTTKAGNNELGIKLSNFIEGLLADEINIEDSEGNIIKIEDAKEKVTLEKDDEAETIKVKIDNDDGQEIVFDIPLDELTDEFVQKYTNYQTVDELLASLDK